MSSRRWCGCFEAAAAEARLDVPRTRPSALWPAAGTGPVRMVRLCSWWSSPLGWRWRLAVARSCSLCPARRRRECPGQGAGRARRTRIGARSDRADHAGAGGRVHPVNSHRLDRRRPRGGPVDAAHGRWHGGGRDAARAGPHHALRPGHRSMVSLPVRRPGDGLRDGGRPAHGVPAGARAGCGDGGVALRTFAGRTAYRFSLPVQELGDGRPGSPRS